MFNGSALNDTCVVGFDQFGFAIGSSSSAWNFWLLESMTNNTEGQFAKRALDEHNLEKRQSRPDAANPEILSLVSFFESTFNLSLNDSLYAVYPNPFQGYNNSLVDEDTLEIVDGSESGQTIPFWPVLQPERNVDFIVAFDASGETPFGWQNGTNMIDTYNAATAARLPFPKMPTAETFIEFQYNQLPTFFGCDEDTPLVHPQRPIDVDIIYLQCAMECIYQFLIHSRCILPGTIGYHLR
jgi:lysophospholipase